MKRDVIIRAKKKAFLVAYAQLGIVTAAAKKAGIGRRSHNRWLKKDPTYVRAFDEAELQAIEAMETEARRRAVKGTVKPVFYKGKRCGGIREYSDLLLIFLLKAKRPDVYRDNPRLTNNSGDRLAELIATKVAGPIERGQLYNP